jgi:hypothetical protein
MIGQINDLTARYANRLLTRLIENFENLTDDKYTKNQIIDFIEHYRKETQDNWDIERNKNLLN